MTELPASLGALCGLALLLGARHGLDPDHLATIDGLTRLHAVDRPRLARAAGAWFSLGHGLVVLVVALATSALAHEVVVPPWLAASGLVVSATCLFGVALLNVGAALATPRGGVVAPAGLRAALLGRVSARSAVGVAGIGALFALSFDTVSLAALFALAASHFGGALQAALAALVFAGGMVLVDGVNGLWMSRLMRNAGASAATASRMMALGVAAVAAAVGVLTVMREIVPHVDRWAGHHALWLVAAVPLALVGTFVVATARRRVR